MKETEVVRISIFLFFFCVLIEHGSYSQCETLEFIELGSSPAYCRTAPYQSGYGVVYAAATGGTPDYTYEWTNLYNGMSTMNATVGTVNPGDYHIKVTDDAGCVITAIVKVDSVLPAARFDVVQVDLNANDYGITVAEVTIQNTSKHHVADWWAEPAYPELTDTGNYINVDGGTWEHILFFEERSFSFYDIGLHQICMATTNYNGCTDTICKSITIAEPTETAPAVNITSSSVSGEFIVELLLDNNVQLTLFDLSGVAVLSQTVVPGFNAFTILPGQYIYEIADPLTNAVITSGTFFVL